MFENIVVKFADHVAFSKAIFLLALYDDSDVAVVLDRYCRIKPAHALPEDFPEPTLKFRAPGKPPGRFVRLWTQEQIVGWLEVNKRR